MVSISFHHLHVVLLPTLLASQFVCSETIGKRSTTDVSRVSGKNGAILFKNGQQTSCEVNLFYSSSGYAAANCFDLDSSGNVDSSVKYEVYIESTNKYPSNRTEVEQIHVNPKYDPNTLANNIAVLEFNSGQPNYLTLAALTGGLELEYTYARRVLDDTSKLEWGTPLANMLPALDDGCTEASPLFAANTDSMVCIAESLYAEDDPSCAVPYAAVFARTSKGTFGPNAIYSHSVSYGDNLCTGAKVYHYYTRIDNYTYFAYDVGVRFATFYLGDVPKYAVTKDAGYSQKIPDTAAVSGTRIIGPSGITPRNALVYTSSSSGSASGSPSQSNSQSDSEASSQAASQSASAKVTSTLSSKSSSTAVSEAVRTMIISGKTIVVTDSGQGDRTGPTSTVTTTNPPSEKEAEGLTKGAIAGIAVGATAAALLVISGTIFYFIKRSKKKSRSTAWDPTSESEYLRTIGLDSSGTENFIGDLPPSYHEIRSGNSFASDLVPAKGSGAK